MMKFEWLHESITKFRERTQRRIVVLESSASVNERNMILCLHRDLDEVFDEIQTAMIKLDLMANKRRDAE